MDDIKKIIEELLLDTNREGVKELLKYLEESGFYDAPASTQFHGSHKGALAEHSRNVYDLAMKIGKRLLSTTDFMKCKDSITICALLHDVGKIGQFGKPYYIENLLKSGEQSKSKPYTTNKELKSLPHEVTSVIEVSKRMELTEDEQYAIAMHNGLYGCFKYDLQGKESPLYMIIHFADMWASRVVEVDKEENNGK